MSYDLSQQFIEFRKQIGNKITTSNTKISSLQTPSKTAEFSVDNLKQSMSKNAKRLKVKSAITNIPLSPKKPISPQKPILKSPLKEQLKSPKRQFYASTSKSQQSQYIGSIPQSYRQKDYSDQVSQIKLYSSKYQKILGEEQGQYYGQLQTKLDQLAQIIGFQDERQRYLSEIDNVINQSQSINAKSRVQRNVDNLHFESKALQSDLMSIKTKISRFSEFNDFQM